MPNAQSKFDNEQGTRWAITVNVPDDIHALPESEQYAWLKEREAEMKAQYDSGEFRYAFASYERGDENGRLHHQGMVVLAKQHRRIWLSNRLPGAHITKRYAKSSDEALRAYADGYENGERKAGYIGTAYEFGDWPLSSNQGQRSDLVEAYDAIRAGELTTVDEVTDAFPAIVARYNQFVRNQLARVSQTRFLEARATELVSLQPRVWQYWLFRFLMEFPVSNREIHFVIDKVGGGGKSTFCDWFELLSGKQVYVGRPSKLADMSHALFEETDVDVVNLDVLFLDIPRSQLEQIGHLYRFLEEIKDGRVFTSKYNSKMRRLSSPHIVVFMNDEPDKGGQPTGNMYRSEHRGTMRDELSTQKLSFDRYVEWHLRDSTHFDPWSVDHEYWGTECLHVIEYDRNMCPKRKSLEFQEEVSYDFPGTVVAEEDEEDDDTIDD